MFICEFVAGVGDVLPPFVRGSSLVACGIFIRNVVQICDDKMTDVKGDSKNLWKLYDVKTSQKYLRITKKKEERLLNSLFMEALFISNTITFYPLPSFSSNRPLFAMCLRMNIEVGIMPSSLVCKPPDSRTTVR